MHSLVETIMNSWYGIEIRKDINEAYKCKTENWMKTEIIENVLQNWNLSIGNYNSKLKQDDGLQKDKDLKNILPCRLG